MRALAPAALVACAALAALPLPAAAATGPRDDPAPARVAVVPPREAAWSEVVPAAFDTGWTLPEGDPTGFLGRVAALAALSLRDADGEPLALPEAPPLATLGDLLRACEPLRGDPAGLDAVLSGLARARPAAWERHGALLADLLRDEALFAEDWSPDEDAPRDGFAFGPPRDLSDVARPPWSALSGSRLLQQAAVLVRADAAAFKAVENDYLAYLDHVGSTYESIRPLPGTHLRGLDDHGRPFAALQLQFRCDLPFPFTSYDCRLRILNRVDDGGRLVADVYSTSEDFHWLAGRDVFHALRDGEGAPAGLLLVRQFGFDLDGVPDGDEARRAALRGALGNLKRRAEAARRLAEAAARADDAGTAPAVDGRADDAPAAVDGAVADPTLPDFVVRGPAP